MSKQTHFRHTPLFIALTATFAAGNVMADPPSAPTTTITNVQVTEWAFVGPNDTPFNGTPVIDANYTVGTLPSGNEANSGGFFQVFQGTLDPTNGTPSTGNETLYDVTTKIYEEQTGTQSASVLAQDGNLTLLGETELVRERTYYVADKQFRFVNQTTSTELPVNGTVLDPTTLWGGGRAYDFAEANPDDLWETTDETYMGGGNLTMDGTATVNNGITVLTRNTLGGSGNTTYGEAGTGAGVLHVDANHAAIGAFQTPYVEGGDPHDRGFNGLYADSEQTVITGGTGTTSITVNQSGVTVNDSTNGQTFRVSSAGDATIRRNLTVGSNVDPKGSQWSNTTVTGATTLNGTADYYELVNAEWTKTAEGKTGLTVNGADGTDQAAVINSNGSTRALDVNGAMHVKANNQKSKLFVDQGNGVLAEGDGARMQVNGTNAQLTNSIGKGMVVDSQQTQIGGGTASTYLTLNNSGATFSSNTNGTGAVRVTGVADGVNQYDAVNYGQVQSAYSSLKRDIDNVEDKANAGVAAAVALAGIPSPAAGKQYSVGAGWGNYEGENAFALGGRAQITPEFQLTAGWGYSEEGNAFNVGAGYSW